MDLSEDKIKKLKEKIIRKIESSFPEEKKEFAMEKVRSMNNEEFIDFLKKNKIPFEENEGGLTEEGVREETPFRLIVKGKIPSYNLEENKDSLAVLEINPISKGHSIIIPKKPVYDSKKIPKSVLSLSNKISKRIEANLKPKEVLVSPSNVLGEIIINILPIYSNESLSSPKNQASKEELESLKNLLEKRTSPKIERKPKTKKIEETKIRIPRRIP